ncbi:phosphomannomutase [Shewanella sp. Isolate11]|uniref:phosphomannomutase n=1 Tax=Shewanella sp. Isolate11 TaxID=2908530 RepID=UPI0023D8A228|nr:phosphomannomutase [Shewanella sp. Isolate11]
MDTRTLIAQSGIAFGTSGARGLVSDFTPDVNAAFAIAFINSISDDFEFDTVAIAIDNRPSSYAIAQACAAGIKQLNQNVIYYGVIPTPALAYKAMQDGMPCIMVTGSHIPFDRNGLKFYRPDGEITKADEQAILNIAVTFTPLADELEELSLNNDASRAYIERYQQLFDNKILAGKHIGIYEHSSAGRDIYSYLFESLGAKTTSLGRSDEFVPIDTEAVSEEDKQRALDWSKQYGFDALYSTDGDGDRPLIADENGNWLRGDILGLLCSQQLGIEALAVPVSCNSAIEQSQNFTTVVRTKIGSPYVIAEFSELAKKSKTVAGFEANGGYLLGSDIKVNSKNLKALPTRDALLPALMLLAQRVSISMQLKEIPQRFTASDRLQNFSRDKSERLIEQLTVSATQFLANLDYKQDFQINNIDGLRITLECGDIIHLRPSGNAPELRCYSESSSQAKASKIVSMTLKACGK